MPATTVVSLMAPARSPKLIEQLQAQRVTGLAMDAVPRISRAQAMDVLSSMANVAGYRAVIEAAHAFGRQFTGQVTAAGKVPPARVFVVGAGVAGLAAIGAAGSMGAIVRAFDVRPEVAEQVESMGAEFVTVEMEQEVSSDGYAKEMTAEQEAATAAMYDEEARNADIVITTALIPGRPAPRLITAETVAGDAHRVGHRRHGRGQRRQRRADPHRREGRHRQPGHHPRLHRPRRPARRPDQPALRHQRRQPLQAAHPRQGRRAGPRPRRRRRARHHRGPRRRVDVAAAAGPGERGAGGPGAPRPSTRQPRPVAKRRRTRAASGTPPGWPPSLFALVAAYSPPDFLGHFTVFALAVFVGYYVISNVAHALHTPLMSETNAISGIIVVGGILQVGSDNLAVTVLALVAVLVASINIFGGFLVTLRMLEMFRKD